jgi:hypothetical protein
MEEENAAKWLKKIPWIRQRATTKAPCWRSHGASRVQFPLVDRRFSAAC